MSQRAHTLRPPGRGSRYVVMLVASVAAPVMAGTGEPSPFTEEAVLRGVDYACTQFVPFGDSLAFADLDDDGDPDLLTIGRLDGTLGVYENDGTGFFTDRYATSGIPALEKFSGVSAGDYDRDGDLDILVTRWAESDHLFRNDGGFTFVDVTSEAGLGDTGEGAGAAWCDFDLDGWLDIYVPNHDGGNRLYRSRGLVGGAVRFVEVAELLDVFRDEQLTFQASFIDYDRDGDADLYLANSYGQHCADLHYQNLLFRNDGGVFTDVTEEAGAEACVDSMSIGIGDFDLNGYQDIYVTDNNTPGNVLLLGQGDHFVEDAAQWGVESFATAWGACFFDFDHDGIQDLYVCNLSQPNRLYRHDGAPPAVDVGPAMGVDFTTGSFSNAFADVDGDGDLDLAVANRNDRVRLYINHEGEKRSWIKLDVIGREAQRWALNATADLRTGRDWQLREVVAGSNYKAQNELILHWGLGDVTMVDEIRVVWNGGESRVLRNLRAGETWTAYPDGKLGDANDDGIVDHDDMARFLACYTGSAPGSLDPGCEMMDFLGNGHVDEADYAALMARFVGVVADCDENGTDDYLDILAGTAMDVNRNAVIDLCEHLGDLDGDERIDAIDLQLLLEAWGSSGDEAADLDRDGLVGLSDLLVVLSNWTR